MPAFPKVSGSNLEGRKFNLPGDFEGELNLAVVPFQRWHQDLVDGWVPYLKLLAEKVPAFRFYEIPTLARMNTLYRWGIDSGMRAGIPDPRTRAITITLYLDKEAYRRALEIPDEETIHLFLVDRSGHIYWRGAGEASEEKAIALADAVAAAYAEMHPAQA